MRYLKTLQSIRFLETKYLSKLTLKPCETTLEFFLKEYSETWSLLPVLESNLSNQIDSGLSER